MPGRGPEAARRMSGPAISGDDLWRAFGTERVLRGAQIVVPPGGGVAVLGPNGSGKSTLLSVLAALLRPSRGRVRVCDRDPFAVPDARRDVGYVGHEPMLYGGLTVRENLRLWGTLYGVPDGRARAGEACTLLGLDRHVDVPVRRLSRGLAQRAALARAVLHRPAALLLDEVLGGLDLEAAERVCALFREFRGRGGALIFATHNPQEALRVADHACVLVGGRVSEPRPLAGMDAAAVEAWYRAAVSGDAAVAGAE